MDARTVNSPCDRGLRTPPQCRRPRLVPVLVSDNAPHRVMVLDVRRCVGRRGGGLALDRNDSRVRTPVFSPVFILSVRYTGREQKCDRRSYGGNRHAERATHGSPTSTYLSASLPPGGVAGSGLISGCTWPPSIVRGRRYGGGYLSGSAPSPSILLRSLSVLLRKLPERIQPPQ